MAYLRRYRDIHSPFPRVGEGPGIGADHLGNVRTVLTTDPNYVFITRQSDYYPFGLEIPLSGISDNQIKYNGKEFQDEANLDWYDYGARFYDPTLGRWHSVDPMAEKYYGWSSYNYVANNPVILIDPEGNDIVIYYKDNGESKTYRFNGTTNKETPTNKFVASVIQAWNYNVSNGGGEPSFEAATNSELEIGLSEYDMPSTSSEGNVFWNPNVGLECDNGVVLSPATVLDHELDHQVDFSKNPYENREMSLQGDDQFGTKEEKRVITGSEQKTAKANGEIQEGQTTRNNHKGTTVVTSGTTSNKVNNEATYNFLNNLSKEGFDVSKSIKRYENK